MSSLFSSSNALKIGKKSSDIPSQNSIFSLIVHLFSRLLVFYFLSCWVSVDLVDDDGNFADNFPFAFGLSSDVFLSTHTKQKKTVVSSRVGE